MGKTQKIEGVDPKHYKHEDEKYKETDHDAMEATGSRSYTDHERRRFFWLRSWAVRGLLSNLNKVSHKKKMKDRLK